MTLLYIEKSHYDLISSKKGKRQNYEKLNVDKDTLNATHNDTMKELEDIKIENEKLVSAYSESLQKLKILEDQIKNDQPSYEHKSQQKENFDEQILLEGKRSGFSRTGPQAQSIAKPIVEKVMQGKKCDVCQEK